MHYHDHDRDSFPRRELKEKKALTLVLCFSAGFMILEAAAGYFTGSLALLSDAAHMLMDIVALSLALFAIWFSLRPPTSRKTFGFYRAEILAAFLNSLILFIISIVILIEAYNRLRIPNGNIKSLEMSVVALIGLGINFLGIYVLSSVKSDKLNIRGAVLHVISDAIGSFGALVAGLIILKTGWYYADPIASILIAVLILRGAWRLLSESAHILLEGTPKGINLKSLEDAIGSHNGVLGVHDLHAWTLTQGFEALSAHLIIEDIKQCERLIEEITNHLHDEFRINHVTLQVETRRCEPGDINCYGTEVRSI